MKKYCKDCIYFEDCKYNFENCIYLSKKLLQKYNQKSDKDDITI